MSKVLELVLNIAKKRLGMRLMKQLFCLLLMSMGIDKEIIKEEIGVSESSIQKYKKMIVKGTIETIFEDNVYRQPSELDPYRAKIIAEFDKQPPKTLG